MLTSQTFLKKTKRGNILKIVREHYLRDDIWCGSEFCSSCRHDSKNLVLEKTHKSLSKHVKGHYIILDTNVILDQIDILEENVLKNVIILQTVLKEVKHRSSTVFKRLKDVISNPSRKFYTFVNEHHKETYIERKYGETVNDRNDRAIRTAAVWYKNHLKGEVSIVLLTDDNENREKAKEEGIIAFSVEEYVSSLEKYQYLLEKLCKRQFGNESSFRGEYLFPPHYTPSQIHDGVRDGSIIIGNFLASRENFLEGTVNIENQDLMILVQGREGLNRAVDGDTVAVKLLPESQWVGSSDLVLQDDEEEDIKVEEKIVIQKAKETVEKKPTGIVVGIVRRKWRQYCGILQPTPVKVSTMHLFVPAERKIPKVRIETRQSEFLCNQRIIVAIDSWPRHSRYPLGHFVRALGAIGDKDTENEVLLLEHDVPHSTFSEAVLNCLPSLPWKIQDEELQRRVDLRHIDICSVDPPGCTDIDDALHCRNLKNGNFEVGVHIADVTHFVQPGSALDKEAALRGTTVYLVDKRINMFPGKNDWKLDNDLLSENICSLRGGEERYAFSCIWEMTRNAEIVSTKFHKSVIRSKLAMTYEEAQLKIDDKSQNDSLTLSLRNLNNLAKILKKKRMEKGALLSASLEVRFHVDSETLDPIDVEAKQLRETNSMVEEFMLLANISVAEKILKEFPDCALLRRHPEPPLSNFEPLVKAGKAQGFKILVDTGKNLANSLDAAVKKDNPYFNIMLRNLATRCMMQAVYFCCGMLQPEDYYHYGLACPIYTHFTSPIRRYADIIVHRLLAVTIEAESIYPDLLNKKKIHELCHNLNYRKRMAQYAGRASAALHTHLFFRDKIQDEEGYVLYVRKNALQILIPKYGLEGTLYVSGRKELDGIGFVYDAENQTQRCKNVTFNAFDPVTVQVKLDRSNVQHEKLVLQLVYPQIPNFSVPSTTAKRKNEDEDEKKSKKSQKKR